MPVNSLLAHPAYLALGSNLGDRAAHLRAALERLRERGVVLEAVSSFYDTAPLGAPAGTEHLTYLNATACVRTSLPPQELLMVLLEVERALGRRRVTKVRNAPRTIDLDLLLYADQIVNEAGLCLPHPRLHERTFVLKPLAEIAPLVVHPVLKKTVAELLALLK